MLAIIAVGQTAEVPSVEWESLLKDDYSVEYPDSWELSQSGQMGTSFVLFSPISSKQDQFRENINLLIQDLTGYGITFDKYVEISESQISTMITDGKIIESKKVSTDSLFHQKVIYTGRQGVFNLKFEQYYWVENDKAYILTFTCEEDQFEAFKEIGEKILNSFELKLN